MRLKFRGTVETVYNCIADHHQSTGVFPTFDHISQQCGVPNWRIGYYLDQLLRLGKIRREYVGRQSPTDRMLYRYELEASKRSSVR